MDFDIDKDNLLTYFGYLIKSYLKFQEKTISREKLTKELQDLKKLKLSPNVKKHLRALEKRMEDVIEKEKKIITMQKTETVQESEIQNRIQELEKKLTRFISQKKEKKSDVSEVKKQMQKTEGLYKKIRKSSQYTKKDKERIEQRFKKLKAKLR